jgi:uncharacterized OB-fold protein
MTDRTVVPFVEGFFTHGADEPRLLGSRCTTCGTAVFPRSFTCPNPSCPEPAVVDHTFERVGTLASFTVVHYPPPPPFVPPDPFEPFAIAEVAFPSGVQVIGPVPKEYGLEFDLGIDMETIVDVYYTNHDGEDVVGWKFRPVKGAE